MKDSAVSPTLLFDPNRQKRLIDALVQRVAASKDEHARLVRQQDDHHADIEQKLADQLAVIKQTCHADRLSTLRQWDEAQEQSIAAYEAAMIQTQDEVRRCGARFRRLLAEQESVITNKVAQRMIAIKNQYNSHKDQPHQVATKERHQIDTALARSNDDIEFARQLTLRRLNRLLDIQQPSDLYAEFGESKPTNVRDAVDLIGRQNSRLKSTVAEMQAGFAAHVVDAVYYLPSLVAFLLAIFAGTSVLMKAEPLINYLVGSVIVAGLIGFTCYLILMWPLRRMTRSLHPVTERNRLASESAASVARGISKQTAKRASEELLKRRDLHIEEANRWQAKQLDEVRADIQAKQVAEHARLNEQLQRVDQQFQTGFAELQRTMRARADQTANAISQKLNQSDAAAGQTLQSVVQQHQHTLETLAQRLEIGLRRGMNRILAAGDLVEYRHPSWAELLASPPPPHDGVDFLPVGSLRLGAHLKRQFDQALDYEHDEDAADEANILARVRVPDTMPIALHRRRHCGVLIEAPSAHLDDAVKVAHQMLWRLLTAAPPGRARVTLIDPAGRGQNFSSFLALADHDPHLIHHRVWTHGDQITARIAEVGHHAENILQSCLRDQYEQLEDYNADAGALSQPYEAIAAVGFPDGLSREAYAHLMALIRNGTRCGVFTILVIDDKHEWPTDMPIPEHPHLLHLRYGVSGVDVGTDFVEEKHVTLDGLNPSALANARDTADEDGIIPIAKKRRLHLPDDSLSAGHWRCLTAGLDQYEFWPSPPPMPQDRSALINRIGRATVEASRVVVPLRTLLPDERIASPRVDSSSEAGSTAEGIDIVVGSLGAGRHRSLVLGDGVLQHVLIAGKTGSGKSTLLHSIVTSGAAKYSPNELQFYLLDFKKGVEFKIYADANLPHARVIGIESEREFGRSVLHRLDEEMSTRGEQFRAAGVQEMSEYRRQCPGESMPRLMLIVDEFQELFTRDDTLAADCTALLDRLVRQGRSFGIHIVLSSQSLAGANSLPRATLGQMAVRIAMQCSESDAALILADDNTAARLISRPGEAIYNDASGLMEGNHPFQVAYLDKDDQRVMLDEIRARDASFLESLSPAIVFEGNRPGKFTAALANEVIRSATASDTLIGLLGEAVELGPPCSLRLNSDTGRNVLLIGSARNRPSVLGAIIATAKAYAPNLSVVLFDGSRAEEGVSTGSWLAGNSSGENSVSPLNSTLVRPREAEPTMIQIARRVEARLGKPLLDATETEASEPGGFSLSGDGTLVSKAEQLRAASPTVDLPDEDGSPMLVVLDGLDRFRDLRQADSMNFSLHSANQFTGSDALQLVLREGPAAGVFVIVTLPTAETLNRWLPRQSHHDLELRLVGPLNAGDSSVLIDSPAAADLSAATMILYDDADGRTTKFRLCELPTPEELANLFGSS